MPVLASVAMVGFAQDFDTDPTVRIDNEKEDLHFTVGARMMADVAYYHSDFTPMKSGAALTDARLRASLEYKDWYFYADFGFGKGKFSQKNIFVQYSKEAEAGKHYVKAGYYNDPAGSMARNTSIGSYHFISRPGSAIALGEGRELGITYKFENKNWYAAQGIFTEDQYNSQEAGFNGVTVAGRWLWRPINENNETFHIGLNARYAKLGGGVVEKNVLKKTLSLGQSLETYVDDTEKFVSCEIPWAKSTADLGVEALYKNDKFFARGEYMFKYIAKKRDSETLFIADQNNIDAWGTLDAWITANPLKDNKFHGGYVELGYLLLGKPYSYNNAEGILGGLNGKSLEIVARYNYTGLNNLIDGEYYSAGRDQHYPAGYMQDYPFKSAAISGGNVHSATIGINCAFNKFCAVMVNYTYNKLDRDRYSYDDNFHSLQARLMFQF